MFLRQVQYLIVLLILLPLPVFAHGEEVILYFGMVEVVRLIAFVLFAMSTSVNTVRKFVLGVTYFIGVIGAYALAAGFSGPGDDTLVIAHLLLTPMLLVVLVYFGIRENLNR